MKIKLNHMVYSANEIKLGDTFTIAGDYTQIKNPNRKWWQVWKPKIVKANKLQMYRVTEVI
jgi:hypothetical protein